jgi:tripartite-type tricarboxylate transporter receptor subunit TctC
MLNKTLIALGAVLAAQVSPALAQEWPQRPVTMIVSQSAGASPVVMARLIADRLTKSLGQRVIVEN